MITGDTKLPITGNDPGCFFQRLEAISARMWWPLVFAFLVISAWVHTSAGFTLPLPWDDENSFLWPAINFSEHGTLLAPELNPDRPVMWMPPLFMILYGTIFKVVGFSLATARWISWLIMAGAFVSLAVWIKRFPLALISIGILGLLFLSGTAVSIGNVARMDGLALLAGGCCFALLNRGQVWMAASVVAVGVLAHPNAAYIGVAGAFTAFATSGQQKWKPGRGAVICLSLAMVAWLAYGLYAATNWDAFINDMTAQFQRKARRNPIPILLEWPTIGFMACFGVGGLIALIRKSRFTGPIAFGAVCLLIPVFGYEMWYEVYKLIAFWIIGMSILWIINEILLQWLPKHRLLRFASIALAVLPILAFYHRHGFVEGPRGYIRDLTWGWGMTVEQKNVPYFTNEDLSSVSEYVNLRLQEFENTRIEFYPQGDGLFFYGALDETAVIFQPHFTRIRPDAMVVRLSRYIPEWWSDKQAQAVKHIPPGAKPFRVRDSTEQWYFVDMRINLTDSRLDMSSAHAE